VSHTMTGEITVNQTHADSGRAHAATSNHVVNGQHGNNNKGTNTRVINRDSHCLYLIHPDTIDSQLAFFSPSFRSHVNHILNNNVSLLAFEMKKYDRGGAVNGTIWCSHLQFLILGSDNHLYCFKAYFLYATSAATTTGNNNNNNNGNNNAIVLRINAYDDHHLLQMMTDMNNNRNMDGGNDFLPFELLNQPEQPIDETIYNILQKIFFSQFPSSDSKQRTPDHYASGTVYSSSHSSSSSPPHAHCSSHHHQQPQQQQQYSNLHHALVPEIYALIPDRSRISRFVLEVLFYLISCLCLNIMNRYVSISADLSSKRDDMFTNLLKKYFINPR